MNTLGAADPPVPLSRHSAVHIKNPEEGTDFTAEEVQHLRDVVADAEGHYPLRMREMAAAILASVEAEITKKNDIHWPARDLEADVLAGARKVH